MRARLALLALLALPATAQAARPFVTDDARIVDRGGCQVETFVKRQRRIDEHEFWFLPACNPWGAELTAGHIRMRSAPAGDSGTTVLQAKMLLRPIEPGSAGFALSLGALHGAATSPYFNAIGSTALGGDRVVLHGNLGGVRDKVAGLSRGTWGAGAEILLMAPRLYGIIESYGQRGEKPTRHAGLRVWLLPDKVQVDSTIGMQKSAPEHRFVTVGLRLLWQ